MEYTALYRKFRPASFDEVRGQDHIVTTLKNQIKYARIGHAYLFCGTRGTGKTSVAKIFAKAVNCESPVDGNPCGQCASCRTIASGSSTDVIEIDAASNNSVDNIREIREEVTYRPVEGKHKVYIIDEAHMLTTGAFNAFLKTLEEPPEYVIFILATTEASKIPATIMSRCQRYDFFRISAADIADRLRELAGAEGVDIDDAAVRYIARMGDGAMRDSLSLMDQCIACYPDRRITYDDVLKILGAADMDEMAELLRILMARDIPNAIRRLDSFIMQGKEINTFVSDFTWFLRDLLLVKNSADMEDVLNVSTEDLNMMKELSRMIGEEQLMWYIRIFAELLERLRNSVQKRVETELAIIRVCHPQTVSDTEALTERIRILEEKIERGVPAASVPAAFAPCQEPETPARPDKAAPEDLLEIKRRWDTVVNSLGGLEKIILSGAKPEYDAATGENRLFIRVASDLEKKALEKPESKAQIKNAIEEIIEKDVEIEISGEDNKSLKEIPLIERIQEKIAFPVEEE